MTVMWFDTHCPSANSSELARVLFHFHACLACLTKSFRVVHTAGSLCTLWRGCNGVQGHGERCYRHLVSNLYMLEID
jgi:hypothetical protein